MVLGSPMYLPSHSSNHLKIQLLQMLVPQYLLFLHPDFFGISGLAGPARSFVAGSALMCVRATIATEICCFNYALIFLPVRSKELLHHNQMFLFLRV